MKIIYGTTNKEKVNQIKVFLQYKQLDIEILTLQDIGFDEEIEETGTTFEENSLIKANAIKRYCNANEINEIILADDAGLCVDALDGRPGIYSARYYGKNLTQKEKIDFLLKDLEGVEDPNRTAQFVCVLTAIMPNEAKIICRGETKGKIAKKPDKLEKLTYEPIFIPDGFEKTMNQLTPEELGNTHREKALLEFLNFLL